MRLLTWLSLLPLVLLPARAAAGGLYFTERGVHGLGRAGAYVAGATGLDSIGYNAAGLRGTGVLLDLTLLRLDVKYRRALQIEDSAGNTQTVYSPEIRGQTEALPLPTLVAGLDAWGGKLSLAAGVFSPTFALMAFPSRVAGQPSPARYTLSGFSDSRLALGGAWVAFRPHDRVSVGAGVHALVGTFRSALDFTLSLPDRLLAAPEDPDYDAHGRVSVGPFAAPSATLGVQVRPTSWLSLGASGDLPTWIDSDATFAVRLPDSPVFDDVSIRGKRARVRMRLPAIARVGLEVRWLDALRVELCYVREFWSLHDAIVVRPRGVRIEGIPGGPSQIALPTIRIQRGFKDAGSLRLGAEFHVPLGSRALSVRAGVAREQSAIPPAYLSLSSLDFEKWTLALGASVQALHNLRLDVGAAHLILKSENVTPLDARLTRVNPLQGNAPAETVNGGRYRAHANVLSAGLTYAFP